MGDGVLLGGDHLREGLAIVLEDRVVPEPLIATGSHERPGDTASERFDARLVGVGHHRPKVGPSVVLLASESPHALDTHGILDVRRIRTWEATESIDEQPGVVDENAIHGGINPLNSVCVRLALKMPVGLPCPMSRDVLEGGRLDFGVVIVDLLDGRDALEVVPGLPKFPVVSRREANVHARGLGKGVKVASVSTQPPHCRLATGVQFAVSATFLPAASDHSRMDPIVDHVMIRVEDLEESLDWYQTHLNYEEKGRWEADTFTNVFLGPEEMHDDGALLELTYNHDGRSYELGDAWGHIAVRVPEDELDSSYQQLMDEGVEDYRDPESCGNRYAFVKDPDGHEIEIVKRDYGAKWSLDHTMIRVEDATEALGYWVRTYGYEEVGRWEADTFANFFVQRPDAAPEEMSVELTYNYDGRSYTMGDAWGHLAVSVEDLHDAWDTMLERETADYRDPESCNDRYAFTKDQDGHEVEVVTRD